MPADSCLQIRELGGAAALELVDRHGLLAQWRYTPAKAKAAHHFLDRWKAFRNGQTVHVEGGETSDATCPSCGAPLKGEQGFCEACLMAPGVKAGRSLLRLLTFSRKRAPMALFGFALTIAGTAASMVPPYLTRPMMDDVLIPFTEKGVMNTRLVPWLLGGLALGFAVDVGLGLGTDLRHRLGQRTDHRRSSQPHLRPPARHVAGVFRRQAHRRPDLARKLRLGPAVLLPLGQLVGFCQRRADVLDDGCDPALASIGSWPGARSCRCR